MKCEKCGHESEKNKQKFGKPLCKVCYQFAPIEKEIFFEYVSDKIEESVSEVYRKYLRSRGEQQKKGMIEQAKKGKHVSRPPFGYKKGDKGLFPDENSRKVEQIFLDFKNKEIPLAALSKKYNLSINGLKKILRNFTYLGKIKFNGEIHEGKHKAIVSSILFNQVQDKLERLGTK